MEIRSTSLSAATLALAMFCFAGSAAAIPLHCWEASGKKASTGDPLIASCPGVRASFNGGPRRAQNELRRMQNEILASIRPDSGASFDPWLVQVFPPKDAGDWRFVRIPGRDGGVPVVGVGGNTPTKKVPEPGTLTLFGLGLLGAGLARRYRRTS